MAFLAGLLIGGIFSFSLFCWGLSLALKKAANAKVQSTEAALESLKRFTDKLKQARESKWTDTSAPN